MTAKMKMKIVERISLPHGQSYRTAYELLAKAQEARKGEFAEMKLRKDARWGFTILCYNPVEAEVQMRGTCQLCGGDFSVEKKTVALHGYKRPRWGYIIGRCPGTDHLPAEHSVRETEREIATQQKRLKALVVTMEKLRGVQNEHGHWSFPFTKQDIWPADFDSWTPAKQTEYREGEKQLEKERSDARHEWWQRTDYVKHLKETVLPRLGEPLLERLK